MILFPNAKINLGLNVVARRPDGYHDIESVLYPTAWTDILEIVPAKGSVASLHLSGNAIACSPEKNLVMKALQAFESYTGLTAAVDIFLHKIIPDGAGLGGGSADAAFAILGLNAVLNAGLTPGQMAEIAADVGSDSPFFIYNRPMLATGTGTCLTPVDIDLSGMVMAIVKPPQSVSTAQAYARVTPGAAAVRVADAISRHPSQWRHVLHNDFEESVFAQCPEVERTARLMASLNPVYSAMSGSGSAVFGLFADTTATDVDRLLERTFPGMPRHVR